MSAKVKKMLLTVAAIFGGAVLVAAIMRAKKATDAGTVVPGAADPSLQSNVIAELKSLTQTS
jgi:hypothetical protein